MNTKCVKVIGLLMTLSVAILAQNLPEPHFKTAELPMYPQMAALTQLSGDVRISFILTKTGEPTDVRALSGAPLLQSAALANVKTWKFDLPHDLYRTEWRYETRFTYRFSGKKVEPGEQPTLVVKVHSFHEVEITSDQVKHIPLL